MVARHGERHSAPRATLTMYDLTAYSKMLADTPRVHAYAEALRRVVREGAIVLDLGTGPGIFAMLACRAGARRVYAVEPDPIVGLARTLASANGLADRIVFIEASSRTIDLPERADVVVADIRGILPLRRDALVSLIDARQRHLRAGGTIVPASDAIVAAVVEAPGTYRQSLAGWDGAAYGLDLAPARAIAPDALWRMAAGDGRLLSEARVWSTLDYQTVETPNVRAMLQWDITETGAAHGVMLWFEACLAPGVSFSTGPSDPPLVYGRALLPWPSPVACEPGVRVEVDLRADFVNDDYVWTWVTTAVSPTRLRTRFRQSTLTSALLSKAQLGRA